MCWWCSGYCRLLQLASLHCGLHLQPSSSWSLTLLDLMVVALPGQALGQAAVSQAGKASHTTCWAHVVAVTSASGLDIWMWKLAPSSNSRSFFSFSTNFCTFWLFWLWPWPSVWPWPFWAIRPSPPVAMPSICFSLRRWCSLRFWPVTFWGLLLMRWYRSEVSAMPLRLLPSPLSPLFPAWLREAQPLSITATESVPAYCSTCQCLAGRWTCQILHTIACVGVMCASFIFFQVSAASKLWTAPGNVSSASWQQLWEVQICKDRERSSLAWKLGYYILLLLILYCYTVLPPLVWPSLLPGWSGPLPAFWKGGGHICKKVNPFRHHYVSTEALKVSTMRGSSGTAPAGNFAVKGLRKALLCILGLDFAENIILKV